MGDYDRIFGAGTNVESLIDSFNESEGQLQTDHDDDLYFDSYEEASNWSKENGGARFYAFDNKYYAYDLKKSKNGRSWNPPVYKNKEVLGDFVEEIFKMEVDSIDESFLEKYIARGVGFQRKEFSINPAHLIGMEKALNKIWHMIVPVSDYIYLIYEEDEQSLGGWYLKCALRIKGVNAILIEEYYDNQYDYKKIILGKS